jgi:L-Ala-D/L-Glu epimerase
MSNAPLLTWEPLTLKLRNPFRLSYGTSETRQVFWIRLKDDSGWGESAIPPYYGVKDEDMIALWENVALHKVAFPEEIGEISNWVGEEGPAPARCALQIALFDRIARLHGLPLYRLLDLPIPKPKATCFTIAIDTPEEMARRALEVKNYPIIKVKLGSENDIACLEAIRQARPEARLYVDANAGWECNEALRMVKEIEGLGIDLIEQPVKKEDIEGLGRVQSVTTIPVVADESLQSLEDIEKLSKAGVKGVNIKLMKIGGLIPALQVIKRAKELGMRVMLGQMIETSIGTTAMMHLSGLAEWIDLDTPKLISNDPFDGVIYNQYAVISLPERTGNGVILKSN